eukprot:354901-Chlamydomonas_euryale.AAC.2
MGHGSLCVVTWRMLAWHSTCMGHGSLCLVTWCMLAWHSTCMGHGALCLVTCWCMLAWHSMAWRGVAGHVCSCPTRTHAPAG